MTASDRQASLQRVTSGVSGLDEILDGGFLHRGTYIVMGPPGAGKTILGNQICFHYVASGKRAIYITLLAETHGRMLEHLGSMRFFDPAPVSAALTYVSGYQVLEQSGTAGLLDLIRKMIREHGATLLVLDGLVSAEEFSEGSLSFKKFILELNIVAGIIGCMTILLTNDAQRAAHPEHTMVDGIIELSDAPFEGRAVRELVVHKFRGSNHLRGRHVFEISDEGVTVYPRLEARLARAHTPAPAASARLRTGEPKLDEMLDGGLIEGSTTLVLGPPGSGKTTLGLCFLAAGAREGERGLYFGFHESPDRLSQKGDALGFELGKFGREGAIDLEWHPRTELLADAVADRLLSLLRARGVRRLFIDGLDDFRSAMVHEARLGRFFAALAAELRALGVTTIFSKDASALFGSVVDATLDGLSATADNVIFVRQVELRASLWHVLSIIKTRESDHRREIRLFTIGRDGLVLGEPLIPSAPGILTGQPSEAVIGDGRAKKITKAAASSKTSGRRGGRKGAARPAKKR